MPSPEVPCRFTRCCDAQGAGAVVFALMPLAARRGGRVNREECLW